VLVLPEVEPVESVLLGPVSLVEGVELGGGSGGLTGGCEVPEVEPVESVLLGPVSLVEGVVLGGGSGGSTGGLTGGSTGGSTGGLTGGSTGGSTGGLTGGCGGTTTRAKFISEIASSAPKPTPASNMPLRESPLAKVTADKADSVPTAATDSVPTTAEGSHNTVATPGSHATTASRLTASAACTDKALILKITNTRLQELISFTIKKTQFFINLHYPYCSVNT
jgi:hypothetical protein